MMRTTGKLFAVVTGLGFLASLAAAYKGMRDVMVTSGGFCASGGPYAIAQGHQCNGTTVAYLLGGIGGMVVLGGITLVLIDAADGPAIEVGLIGWAALFGALGFNFISLGFNPPKNMGGGGAWILCGVVFWAMAIGGLVPIAGEAIGWLRRGGKPEPPPASAAPFAPIVRAAVRSDVPPGPAQ
jgi:hypothetical protein